MANFVTLLRIVLSVSLLFMPTFSIPFYIIYLAAGLTDMIDGTIARITNSVSDFGSKLDTIADFIFLVICFIKIFSAVTLPGVLYCWIGFIALIKFFNAGFCLIKQKKMIAVHTVCNKITGFLLFLFPLSVYFLQIEISAIILCSVATAAAIYEGYRIRTMAN